MIDALFGSKTRVKLLHLFFNNPGQAFYVREITRLIDEQINSVRRELSNMLEVGVITSDSSDNKLYYQVNQRYEHYAPLRAIFADDKVASTVVAADDNAPHWQKLVKELPGVRLAVASGALMGSLSAGVDLLLVGDIPRNRLVALIRDVETGLGHEVSYTVLPYDEFYYRLSVHDRFISGVTKNRHQVIVDTDGILK